MGKFKRIFVLAGLCTVSTWSFADWFDAAKEPAPVKAATKAPAKSPDKADLERENLAALVVELGHLRKQVQEAARTAPVSRVQFRYDWLARDLELIQRGIEDHMDAPRQPRPSTPLKGDYRR